MDLYQSWDQPGYIISILKGLEAYLFFQVLTFYNIHVVSEFVELWLLTYM